MSHTSGTMNFLIHDSQGNPQYVKIQSSQPVKTTHSTTKSTFKAIPQETVKALLSQKPQVLATGPGSVISPNQVLRALAIGGKKQLVTIPVQTPVHTIIKEEKATLVSTKTTGTPSIVLPSSNSKQQYVTILDNSSASKKRPETEEAIIEYCSSDLPQFNPQPASATKRRKTEKGGKGLRHFSMKVCEKVRTKGTTSYNEVADELVAEFTNPNLIPNSVDQQYDQKNIRRRVYDALNVLMAMNIISKEKKEIRWIGLPTTAAQECNSLISEKKSIADRIKAKTQQLNELILKQISLRSLIQRNRELEKLRGSPQPNTAMRLPFIVVNTDKKTEIDCSITNDKSEYHFIFNDKFEIINDIDVLKLIGLTYGLENGTIAESNLEKVKSMIPKALESYVIKMAREPMQENGLESVDYFGMAGPSSDVSFGPEETSTSDEESMASTDVELN